MTWWNDVFFCGVVLFFMHLTQFFVRSCFVVASVN